MPPLWTGEPNGDNHLPSVWCESHRRVASFWQGPPAERDGSATECHDDSVVHRACVKPRHQPTCCGAGHSRAGPGRSWYFGAQPIWMAFFGW